LAQAAYKSLPPQVTTKLRAEIERIDDAFSRIRCPLTFSDQVYNLRSHIDIVRRKIAARTNKLGRMAAE
jgi:hypothetical protein